MSETIPEDVMERAYAALNFPEGGAVICIARAILADRAARDVGVTTWQPLETAPKDGTILRLCIRPSIAEDNGWTPFEDSADPYETIGFNSLAHTGEDEWQFAGWDWCHDCFTEGDGEVIGWMYFDSVPPQPDWQRGVLVKDVPESEKPYHGPMRPEPPITSTELIRNTGGYDKPLGRGEFQSEMREASACLFDDDATLAEKLRLFVRRNDDGYTAPKDRTIDLAADRIATLSAEIKRRLPTDEAVKNAAAIQAELERLESLSTDEWRNASLAAEAKCAELEGERDLWKAACRLDGDILTQGLRDEKSRSAALAKDVERLRDALRPFADAATRQDVLICYTPQGRKRCLSEAGNRAAAALKETDHD